MKTLISLILGSLISSTLIAQNPEVSAAFIAPAQGLVNQHVTFSVDFTNNSTVDITNPDPVNAPTTLVFSPNKFAADIVNNKPVVSGPGSTYFDWTFAPEVSGVKSILGKQKAGVIIPGIVGFPPNVVYAGGAINIEGKYSAASTQAEADASNGTGFVIQISPGAGGDLDRSDFSNLQTVYSPTTGTLPVKLSSFAATAEKCNARLSWKSTEELNSKAYVIEWSADAVRFTKVGEVLSINSAIGSSYIFDHNVSGSNNYYRLKMVDLDGTFKYSDIVSVKSNCSAASVLIIGPNPVQNILNINGLSGINTIVVYNSLGARVQTQKTNNVNEKVNMSQLGNGTYVIKIIDSNNKNVITQNVVKN